MGKNLRSHAVKQPSGGHETGVSLAGILKTQGTEILQKSRETFCRTASVAYFCSACHHT